MHFYGFEKTTLLDYPGEIAATIFTFGCDLRCPFCHNPELILNELKPSVISWQEILSYLKKRKKLLTGVCISGGEPLLYNSLSDKINQIRELGLKVKIDTNGLHPDTLKKLNCNFIAMDIKTSLKKYSLMNPLRVKSITPLLQESINYIIQSQIDYEFRTTVVPDMVTFDDIINITKIIKGAKKYVLAQFRPYNTLENDMLNKVPYLNSELENMKNYVEKQGINCIIRNISLGT